MTGRLDPATLRALIAEIERSDAPTWVYDIEHVASGAANWLQAHLDALPKEPGESLPELPCCPVHENLLKQGKLEPFDNCICCIRNERNELRRQVIEPRIPPDLAKALREWREWVKERTVGYSSDRMLADAIDAARERGEL